MSQKHLAEQAILCYLFHNPSDIFDYDGMLTEKDFDDDANKAIYATIKCLTEEEMPVDTWSVQQRALADFNNIDDSQLKTNLDSLNNRTPPNNINESINYLVTQSTKKLVKRKLKGSISKIDQYENPIDIIESLEKDIFIFTSSIFDSNQVDKLGSGMGDMIQERIAKAQSGETQVGISSGYPLYDSAIGGGLRPSSISVIGARVKTGKSFLALSMARAVAQSGIPVLYLDTELDKEYQMTRLLSQMTNVPLYMVERGLLNDEDVGKLHNLQNYIENDLPLYYESIKGYNISKQISAIRRWFAQKVGKNENGKYKPALVVLDYFKLMNPEDKHGSKEWEVLGYRMTALHDLMASYNSPMLMMVQLNRDGIEKAGEASVSGSDRILWLCDNFSILSFKSPEEIEAMQAHAESNGNPGQKFANMKLKVLRCRHGPGNYGDSYVGIYGDIRDNRVPTEEKCGIFHETKVEKPILE